MLVAWRVGIPNKSRANHMAWGFQRNRISTRRVLLSDQRLWSNNGPTRATHTHTHTHTSNTHPRGSRRVWGCCLPQQITNTLSITYHPMGERPKKSRCFFCLVLWENRDRNSLAYGEWVCCPGRDGHSVGTPLYIWPDPKWGKESEDFCCASRLFLCCLICSSYIREAQRWIEQAGDGDMACSFIHIINSLRRRIKFSAVAESFEADVVLKGGAAFLWNYVMAQLDFHN